MYDIKDLIQKMKIAAGVNSNVELSNILNISYNTLNTWIKRKKLPQDVIFNFAKKYNLSLDYLIFDKKETLLSAQNLKKVKDEKTENTNFKYFGVIDEFNINYSTLQIDTTPLLYDNGLYLLLIDKIYLIVKATFDPFNKEVLIKNNHLEKKLTLSQFLSYKKALIKSSKN